MKIKITSFYFIAFLISFSANAQSTIDTIHYSNSFKICSKENSYFIKLIRFDSDSKIVGDITSLLGRHGLPQNKNELKKAFDFGGYKLAKSISVNPSDWYGSGMVPALPHCSK